MRLRTNIIGVLLVALLVVLSLLAVPWVRQQRARPGARGAPGQPVASARAVASAFVPSPVSAPPSSASPSQALPSILEAEHRVREAPERVTAPMPSEEPPRLMQPFPAPPGRLPRELPPPGTSVERVSPTGEQAAQIIPRASGSAGTAGFLVNTSAPAGVETGGGGTPAESGGTTPGAGAGGGGGSPGPGETPPGTLVKTIVKRPPRFREQGVAIGDAVDVSATGQIAFPTTLTLAYDPFEPQLKGVPPESIQAFFFDESARAWSTQGLSLKRINVSDGSVEFDTTHLTVFRLGVPRGRPPLVHELRPLHSAPNHPITLLGFRFSAPAAQNLLTMGGAYVGLPLSPSGQPQPLELADAGETLVLNSAGGVELDRVVLGAAPERGSSWTRLTDGDAASGFADHATVAAGRLFSPGTKSGGEPFRYVQGTPTSPPQAGELLINEVLLAPPDSFLGDANGDGETIPREDEFVELVNTTSHPLDLGGCTLHTASGERHRFPQGTLLPGGMAVVLFGVDDPASPPQPAGPFGGQTFLPDLSSVGRLVARVPSAANPGTALLTATTFRQTSNPVSMQVLTPLIRSPGFVDASTQLPSLGQPVLRRLRAADLDRDLDVDLVAIRGDAELVVLANDGFGRFAELTDRVPLPDIRNRFFDLALADLTEDGAPELIVGETNQAGSSTQLFMFANNGAGIFQLLSSVGVLNGAAAIGPAALEVVDVDQDEDLDVVVALIGDRPIVFRNDGTGHFSHQAGDALPQSMVVAPTQLELADIDNDGDLDLLLAAGQAGLGTAAALQLFINDGTGHFTDVTNEPGRPISPPDTGVEKLAVADLDKDGDLDLVTDGSSGGTFVQWNDGTGHFERPGSFDLYIQSDITMLALGDVDGDGDPDLIGAPYPPSRRPDALAEVRLNPSEEGLGGIFQVDPVAVLPGTSGSAQEAVVADVDNDGDLDVLTLGSPLQLFLNTGTRINRPPVVEAVTDQSIVEGDLLQFTVQATDADNDSMTLTMTLRSGQPVGSVGASFTDHGDGTGTFAWTPSETQGLRGGKLYEFLATASDAIASDDRIIRVFVHDFNRAPSLDPISAVTVDELVPVTIQLNATDPDADDVLTFGFGAAGLPTGASLNSSTGAFGWTPGPQQGDGPNGRIDYPITFTVTDLAGASDSESATITVLHKNHPPVFAPISPQQVLEEQELVFTVQASDVDGTSPTVAYLELPPGSAFDPNLRRFSWTPTFAQARAQPYLARFEASDGELTSELTVEITVVNVNHPPQFTNLVNRTVAEGQLLQFPVGVADADGDSLTVSIVEALPQGAVFDGQFTWTPSFQQAGTYDLTFQVSDGIDTVSQLIRLTVTGVPHPPTVTPIDDITVQEGDVVVVEVQAFDLDADQLTYTFDPLPAGAERFNPNGSGLTWEPGPDQAGVYPITVRVSDGVTEVTEPFTITVLNNPVFQPLVAQVGVAENDIIPQQTPLGSFGSVASVRFDPGDSLGLDLSDVRPALVRRLELFTTNRDGVPFGRNEFTLYVSADNVTYQPYLGSLIVGRFANRLVLSNLVVSERFVKLRRNSPASDTTPVTNFLPQLLRASGRIPLDVATQDFLTEQQRLAFLYFAENVNANGLIPDRVNVSNGQPVAGTVYSTAATGFWLASLPVAVERGWITQAQGEAFARQTIEFYLGRDGGPVAGQFGFFYHFLNGDGTRFTGFGDDGVSIIDSSLLFLGALAAGEYFDGQIKTLASDLYNLADWDAFYDHGANMLPLVWTPEQGFTGRLDYYSEGMLAYLLAAGSATHPIAPDSDLPGGGSDAYYAFSHGKFGRVLGRLGQEGRPLIQSYFGSLFTYLYPHLFVDFDGLRDRFNVSWDANSREAILANFRFAQSHPDVGYSRVFWGISASDGPFGYQGLYGTPPLDPGAFGEKHDGTIAPYALAGSMPFAADLAFPALQHLAALQNGRLMDLYGLEDGVNVMQDFFGNGYLGIDRGAFLLGLEEFRTGLIGRLVRQSALMQQAFAQLGMSAPSAVPVERAGPRSAHTYALIDTTDHLVTRLEIPIGAVTPATGDFLLELHPFGMDNALGERFVDVGVFVNDQFVKTARFRDRRGDGTVDVGSVYVPIPQALISQDPSVVTLVWVDGERWLQLEDVELRNPTGRRGSQEIWQIGQRDGQFSEFGEEGETDDSYVVGDAPSTFEKALNVVDEPTTDILFELSDIGVDRVLRLVASQTQDGKPVTVQVMINDAPAGEAILSSGGEATVAIARQFLREGWNHLALRHANVPTDGAFIIWDALFLEHATGTSQLQVFVRNITNDQLAPEMQFGLAPPDGAVLSAQHYLEIQFQTNPSFERITIATDNRNSPIHRYTGPSGASAAGLVGTVDSTVTAPLLWQVYDDKQSSTPAFTNTTEWAFVPDMSESNFNTPEAIDFRTLISASGLGERPSGGRTGSSPIVVYLVADFLKKPAQTYGTERLIIELFDQ